MPENLQFQDLHSLFCCWDQIHIWGLVRGEEIVTLSFARQDHDKLCGPHPPAESARQERLCAFLKAILQGTTVAYPHQAPLIRQGTPFQQHVWQLLHQIPFATTTTYGAIAKKLGNPKLARAVGQACNRNPLPIIIPCHRVLSESGLGGFAGGTAIKERLLAYEQRWSETEGKE